MNIFIIAPLNFFDKSNIWAPSKAVSIFYFFFLKHVQGSHFPVFCTSQLFVTAALDTNTPPTLQGLLFLFGCLFV